MKLTVKHSEAMPEPEPEVEVTLWLEQEGEHVRLRARGGGAAFALMTFYASGRAVRHDHVALPFHKGRFERIKFSDEA